MNGAARGASPPTPGRLIFSLAGRMFVISLLS
jgi:hypothetical protein